MAKIVFFNLSFWPFFGPFRSNLVIVMYFWLIFTRGVQSENFLLMLKKRGKRITYFEREGEFSGGVSFASTY